MYIYIYTHTYIHIYIYIYIYIYTDYDAQERAQELAKALRDTELSADAKAKERPE